MAERPIFVPCTDGLRFVREVSVRFRWNPGFAPVQKRKNIAAMHEAARRLGYEPLLEVSTKSESTLGQRLSAFHIKVRLRSGSEVVLESAFQGSKFFERGGPFTDLYECDPRTAKKDPRIRSSGSIKGFSFDGNLFPAEPKTAFYDWLYVCALIPHREYLKKLEAFAGFTDVEFNPARSINCQGRSCALFVSLARKHLLDYATERPEQFIQTVAADSFAQSFSRDVSQGRLL